MREFQEEPSSAQELRDILTPRPALQTVRERPEAKRLLRPLFLGLGLAAASLLLFYAVLSPGFTRWIWQPASGEGSPARLLLEGFLRWYRVLAGVFGGGCVLNGGLAILQAAGAAGCLRTCFRIRKEIRELYLRRLTDWELDPEGDEPEFTPEELEQCRELAARGEPHAAAGCLMAAGVLVSLIAAALCGAVLAKEGILSLPGRAGADLEQLNSGTWEKAAVWISPKCRPSRLPGPWTSGQPEPVTRYGIISEETGGQWVQIYVPEGAGFALDGERFYEENQTVCWNWEHARLYYVGYTTNFHLAAEITPVPPAEMDRVARRVLPPEELEHLHL